MSPIFARLYCFLHLKSRHEDMKLFCHSVTGFRGQGPDFTRVFGPLALLYLIQKFQQIWPLRRYNFLLALWFDFSVCVLELCSEVEILTAELWSQHQYQVKFCCHHISQLSQFPYLMAQQLNPILLISLVVQRLRLCASTLGGLRFNTCLGN